MATNNPNFVDSCAFCQSKDSKYSCPKCSAPYCSVRCYQSRGHVTCAEEFYKDSVEEEMLLRAKEGREDEGRVKQVMEAMRRVNEEACDDELDSDDDEDLANRLADVDLDDSEEVWSRLTEEERSKFEQLLESDEIASILPDFHPWWEEENEKPPLVEVLGEERTVRDKAGRPEVANVPDLKSLTSVRPNPAVKFGLTNVLYSYCYGVRFFRGDHQERPPELFTSLILALSDSLSKNHNFDSCDAAAEAAAQAVNEPQNAARWAVSMSMTRTAKKDVFVLVNSRSDVIAALSDLKFNLERCVKKVKQQSKERERKTELDMLLVKRALKKVEFYLSWSKDYF